MRNLKKILALVLALVMSFSLVTVSSAAFTDADKIDAKYAEAADVLVDLGVIQGRTHANGADFAPLDTIKRAEVAAIIYRIVTGDVEGKQVGMYIGYGDFTDVPADYWGAGYIGFCANGKYVEGHGDGTFGPEDPVTGYQALVMVLRAIGYGEMIAKAGGAWEITAASRAKALGITDNINDALLGASAPRQMVAEIVYRALLVEQAIYTPALNEVIKKAPLGEETFNLKTVVGLVVANEEANLNADNKSALSAGRTEIVVDSNEDGKFGTGDKTVVLAGSTKLNDLGESRYFVYRDHSNPSDRTVLYVADSGLNNVFSTYATATLNSLKSNAKKAEAEWVATTLQYVDFDTASVTGNTAGNFVKVVDNNDDAEADYVLKTNYFLDEVYKVTTSSIKFYDGNGYNPNNHDLYYYEGIAAGDVVILTNEIDGNYFCEQADSFTGVCDTVSYKNKNITVEGEQYYQSAITNLTDYSDNIFNVWEKTEYTYFLDKAGNIAAYKLPESAASEYALLTEAYITKQFNGAYIKNTTPIAEVTIQDAGVEEMIVNNLGTAAYPGYAADFYSAFTTAANLVTAVPGATTNVADYVLYDDSISLYTATSYVMGKDGYPTNRIATDYIAMAAQAVSKGDKVLVAADGAKVNTVLDTEFYIVDLSTQKISYFVGYNNLPAIAQNLISCMYAVATNVDADSATSTYWVADVVVIELNDSIPSMYDTVVMAYNNPYKTTGKVYNLDCIDRDAPAADTSIFTNTRWGAQYTNNVPGFFTVTETGKEYVSIAPITEKYAAHGIRAGVIDRINNLDTRGNYIVLTDGTTLNIKDIPAFFIYRGVAYETEIEATVYKADGVTKLVVGDEGEEIIYVTDAYGYLSYIVLDSYNETTVLANNIMNDSALQSPVGDEVEEALAAYEAAQDAQDKANDILAANGIELTAEAEDEAEAETKVAEVEAKYENGEYASDVEYALALLAAAAEDMTAALTALEAAVAAAEAGTISDAVMTVVNTIIENGEAAIEAANELATEIKAAPVAEETIDAMVEELKAELVYQVTNDTRAETSEVTLGGKDYKVSELTDAQVAEIFEEVIEAWAEVLADETITTIEALTAAVKNLNADIATLVDEFFSAE